MATAKVFGALAIVALAGAAIGILFAPEKGGKTRDKITKSMKDLADDLMAGMKAEANSLMGKAQELETSAKSGLTNAAQTAQKKAGELMNFN